MCPYMDRNMVSRIHSLDLHQVALWWPLLHRCTLLGSNYPNLLDIRKCHQQLQQLFDSKLGNRAHHRGLSLALGPHKESSVHQYLVRLMQTNLQLRKCTDCRNLLAILQHNFQRNLQLCCPIQVGHLQPMFPYMDNQQVPRIPQHHCFPDQRWSHCGQRWSPNTFLSWQGIRKYRQLQE